MSFNKDINPSSKKNMENSLDNLESKSLDNIENVNVDNLENENVDNESVDNESVDNDNESDNDSENESVENDSNSDDNGSDSDSDNDENVNDENVNDENENVDFKYMLKFPIDIKKNYDNDDYIKLFIKMPNTKINVKNKKIYENNIISIIGKPKFIELYFNKKEPLKNVVNFIKKHLNYKDNDNIILTLNNNKIKYGKYNPIGYCGITKYDTINLLHKDF
jgi:hypothetical protein